MPVSSAVAQRGGAARVEQRHHEIGLGRVLPGEQTPELLADTCRRCRPGGSNRAARSRCTRRCRTPRGSAWGTAAACAPGRAGSPPPRPDRDGARTSPRPGRARRSRSRRPRRRPGDRAPGAGSHSASRAATSASLVCITRLNAPFTRESESIRRSSSVASRERASRCTITSLSEVVLKIAPRPSSSRRTARRVHQVAVVRDRDRAAVGVGAEGLRVAQQAAARRRVAHVADRMPARQAREHLLGEHVRDVAHRAVHELLAALRRADAARSPGRGAGARTARGRRCSKPRRGRGRRRSRTRP